MVTPAEFILELLSNVVELLFIFVQEVVLAVDPLTAVSFIVGQVLVVGAVAALGYLALGALAAELGVELPTIGKGQAD